MKKRDNAMMSVDQRNRETRHRLEQCWTKDLNWDLIPSTLQEVRFYSCAIRSRRFYYTVFVFLQGCFQIGKALCVPPVAVLGGVVAITSYIMSPAVVNIPRTEWSESALVWLSINMPTGSTKSALYHYLHSVVIRVRSRCGYGLHDPVWLVGDSTFEKMGELMSQNGGRLLGLYDELSTFLSQLNLYKGKGLSLSHELALFLQLYNGHSWTRATGMYTVHDSHFETHVLGGHSLVTVYDSISYYGAMMVV